ncbi:MAG: hypothetical protein ACFE0P_03845 [Oceanicaulis sp.]
MRLARLVFAAACGVLFAGAPAWAEMRVDLNAEVVDRCAVEGLDAARLEDGVLTVRTVCNAASYTIRLDAGGAVLALAEADAEGAEVELAANGARVRQDAPGARTIALRLAEPADLSGRLQVRIELV